jgi:hypothetical protein
MERKIFQDALFGEMVWDEKFKGWKGKLEFAPEGFVEILISALSDADLEAIEEAQPIFENVRTRLDEICAYAADGLLELYNENWRGDYEPISKEEFCRRIKLESIVFWGEGSTEFYYDDDNLFLRHTIIVSIDDEGNLIDADIAG